jgi:hypothetical protein
MRLILQIPRSNEVCSTASNVRLRGSTEATAPGKFLTSLTNPTFKIPAKIRLWCRIATADPWIAQMAPERRYSTESQSESRLSKGGWGIAASSQLSAPSLVTALK